jgi:hypothetical protein
MTAISANATREEKRQWLTSPLGHAASVSFFGGFGLGLMWLNGMDIGYVATMAVASNAIAYCLILWQSKRLSDATRSAR